MKRERVITIRVNEELYQKTLETIEKKTVEREKNGRKTYWNVCYGFGHNRKGKFTLADLMEHAMKEFLQVSEESQYRLR